MGDIVTVSSPLRGLVCGDPVGLGGCSHAAGSPVSVLKLWIFA